MYIIYYVGRYCVLIYHVILYIYHIFYKYINHMYIQIYIVYMYYAIMSMSMHMIIIYACEYASRFIYAHARFDMIT